MRLVLMPVLAARTIDIITTTVAVAHGMGVRLIGLSRPASVCRIATARGTSMEGGRATTDIDIAKAASAAFSFGLGISANPSATAPATYDTLAAIRAASSFVSNSAADHRPRLVTPLDLAQSSGAYFASGPEHAAPSVALNASNDCTESWHCVAGSGVTLIV